MRFRRSTIWVLSTLTALTACSSNPAPAAPVAAGAPRDSVVRVQRVSGLSFATPVGIHTVIAVPSTLELYSGDSLMTAYVRVIGRDSAGADVAIPAPAYAFARHEVAELRGGFIRAVRPGQATLFVMYDPALWREAEGRPEPSKPFAQVSVTVRPRP